MISLVWRNGYSNRQSVSRQTPSLEPLWSVRISKKIHLFFLAVPLSSLAIRDSNTKMTQVWLRPIDSFIWNTIRSCSIRNSINGVSSCHNRFTPPRRTIPMWYIIKRDISTMVWFILSAKPFCCQLYDTLVWWIVPWLAQYLLKRWFVYPHHCHLGCT